MVEEAVVVAKTHRETDRLQEEAGEVKPLYRLVEVAGIHMQSMQTAARRVGEGKMADVEAVHMR